MMSRSRWSFWHLTVSHTTKETTDMTKTPHPSMEEVRANCVQRIVEKLALAKWLRGIQQDKEGMPRPVQPGGVNRHNDNLAALMQMVGLNAAVIEDDIWADIE